MAKDAKGHGSSGRGGAFGTRSLLPEIQHIGMGRTKATPQELAASQARFAQAEAYTKAAAVGHVTSNEEAAQSLLSTLRATQAPVHDSMRGTNASQWIEAQPAMKLSRIFNSALGAGSKSKVK